MKKIICLTLALCLILGSFSFAFADFTSSDSTNLYNIYQRVNSLYTIINNTMPTFNQISTVNGNLSDIYTRLGTINTTLSTLSTISNTLTTISGKLSSGNYTIASLTESILNWMRPIYNAIQDIPLDLEHIDEGLWKDYGTASEQPYLKRLEQTLTNYRSGDQWTDVTNITVRDFAHRQLISNNSTGEYPWFGIRTDGTYAESTRKWGLGTPLGNIALITNGLNTNVAMLSNFLIGGFNTSQTITDWTDLSTSSVTPTSVVTGLYNLLGNIQTPVSRLSYVLASDERIEAQEASAANEEAVVDNFIDSSGAGSASPSDIGSLSDLSSGYKDNFGSSASVTGIFNIFDSNNFGWFSQETANQLDTSTSTRAKSGSEFNTPLLDQRINDIYDALGVKQ